MIWASLVDDPSGDDSLTEAQQEEERQRLFRILERLVRWDQSRGMEALVEARAEIDRCFPEGPPPILDPFGGGGAIPLEAQRLGLEALSGDLNPVAVLIQKAMTEIPPRFAGRPPVHSNINSDLASWDGVQGLVADVRAYGEWMRDEAYRRIGDAYPDAEGANGERLTPIAWIWARTVESPDPTWKAHVPLVTSWYLSKRKGKPPVWIEPVIDRDSKVVRYEIRTGGTPIHDRTVVRGNGVCIATGAAISGDYIKDKSRRGEMGYSLMAVVAEGSRGRVFLPRPRRPLPPRAPASATWRPTGRNPERLTGGTVFVYGLDEWWKLFTERQLLAMTTFSDLLSEVRNHVETAALVAKVPDDPTRLRDGGSGARAYADAVVTYLAFAIDKLADLGNSLVGWEPIAQCPRHLFGRQSIPMVWDFAEANPFSTSSGSFETCLDGTLKGLTGLGPTLGTEAQVVQREAVSRVKELPYAVVSTDPPYYDNISYADLSDFFFVWLRHGLSEVWPDECATLATPKAEELIANPFRAGSAKRLRSTLRAEWATS